MAVHGVLSTTLQRHDTGSDMDITTRISGDPTSTIEILIADVPRIGVIFDDCDTDPTLVLWSDDGEAIVSLSLAGWLNGTVGDQHVAQAAGALERTLRS